MVRHYRCSLMSHGSGNQFSNEFEVHIRRVLRLLWHCLGHIYLKHWDHMSKLFARVLFTIWLQVHWNSDHRLAWSLPTLLVSPDSLTSLMRKIRPWWMKHWQLSDRRCSLSRLRLKRKKRLHSLCVIHGYLRVKVEAGVVIRLLQSCPVSPTHKPARDYLYQRMLPQLYHHQLHEYLYSNSPILFQFSSEL